LALQLNFRKYFKNDLKFKRSAAALLHIAGSAWWQTVIMSLSHHTDCSTVICGVSMWLWCFLDFKSRAVFDLAVSLDVILANARACPSIPHVALPWSYVGKCGSCNRFFYQSYTFICRAIDRDCILFSEALADSSCRPTRWCVPLSITRACSWSSSTPRRIGFMSADVYQVIVQHWYFNDSLGCSAFDIFVRI